MFLVGRRQLIIPRAATTTGTALTHLDLESKTITTAGDTFQVNVPFTTGGNPISAVTIELNYSYTGAEPPFTVTTITPNSALTQTGEWSFPIKSFTMSGGAAQIKIAAINTSIAGFSAADETILATVTFKATNTPGTISVTFNPTSSKITLKATGSDNLLIPTSSGTYVFQSSGSPSPTPTTAAADPTPTPTTGDGGGGGGDNGNPAATPTPRSHARANPRPTAIPTLPVAGNSFPTAVLAVIGLLFLLIGAGAMVGG